MTWRRKALLLSAPAAIAGWLIWGGTDQVTSQPPAPVSDCNPVTFQGKRFTQCIAVPGKHRIGMKVTGSNGIIYRGFASLANDVDERDLAFAMNGGMYDVGSKPIGYYVENGARLYRLNTRDADGNFYMKPNGVFFGEADGGWRVMTSDAFAEQVSARPHFGTQSGPMLLIGGELHPEISPEGTSLKIRNAVGVDPQGRAHFVISDEPVSFGTIAQFMRDHASASDALFLDGTVSALWDPVTDRIDANYPLGPLIVVTHRRDARPKLDP